MVYFSLVYMYHKGTSLCKEVNMLTVSKSFERDKSTLKELEIRLQELTQTKDEYTLLIDEFNIQYDLKVGDIIRKILIFQEKKSRKKAQNDIKKFNLLERKYHESQAKYELLENEYKILKKVLDTLDKESEEYASLFKQLNSLKIKLTNAHVKFNKAKKAYFIEQEKYKNDPDCVLYETLRKTREEFEEKLKELLEEDAIELSKEMKMELKTLYRKASKLCHPDIVNKDQQEEANKIFQELNAAYRDKDINRVKEIYEDLKDNNHFISTSDSSSDAVVIHKKIENITKSVNAIKDVIEEIQCDETFMLIKSLNDEWDLYFKELKLELNNELRSLKKGEE